MDFTGSNTSGGDGGGTGDDATRLGPAQPQGQSRPGSASPHDEGEPASSRASGSGDFLASIIGTYPSTPALQCPASVTHKGALWHPLKDGDKTWTSRAHAHHFWDSFNGNGDDQRGHFVVRCRVCALGGVSSCYLLRNGKSSNAWRHFNNVACSAAAEEVQRRRHQDVAEWRAKSTRPLVAAPGGTSGPMDGYLTATRSREMTPAQARPHHLRFVLMLVMTMSPFALSGSSYMLEFVRGLGVSYDPPATSGVRDILLDLYSFITDQLREKVRRLQSRYRGLPFFHLITDLWTERHGSGSYGSLVLRCIDPDNSAVAELHLGVAPFTGRHDSATIKAWAQRFLQRYGVRHEDVSSSTSDSGANVKKALTNLWPRWVPCAAHTMHLAVKASLGATGATGAAARRGHGGPSSVRATRGSRGNQATADLLSRGRKIANHFHKSPASVEKLNSVPFPGDDAPRKMVTETPGRWGSTYQSLVRFFTLMPRLIGFWDLDDLTAAQQERQLGRWDWEAVRHLIGVLQPAYEAGIAVQSSSATVADAFGLVCRLRRTIQLGVFPCPKAFDKPQAVGQEAIFDFLKADKGRTNVMELDGRLYKHENLSTTTARGSGGLREEAVAVVEILREELDRRFFHTSDDTKNWLSNDAVLAATLLTPGGAAMLSKAASRVGQDDPTGRARSAVMDTASHLALVEPTMPIQEQQLQMERNLCRTTLLGWDSDDADDAQVFTPLEAVERELDCFLATYVSADDAVSFWGSRSSEFPVLHLVALSLLGASGSSAASERDFSVAGLVLRKDRSRLLPEHVEMHCLVRFNTHLLPADLSSIPALSHGARLSTRSDMSAISVDTSAGGGSQGFSSDSGGDSVFDGSDSE